jgi:hypothetical protein
MNTRLAFVVAAVLLAGSAHAADRIPIYINGTTPDTVGTNYLFQLREQFRASQGYTVVTTETEAAFVVSLVTMDPNIADNTLRNLQTIGSMALQLENTTALNGFLTTWVIQVGKENVPALVADAVANIDKLVQELMTAWKAKAGAAATSAIRDTPLLLKVS